MEPRRIYNVESHYLVEIDDVKSYGSSGTLTKTYSWDVYIASKGSEYRGRADEKNKNISIPWTVLKENNLLEEMIRIIEYTMMKY
ncbi:hypothetical protein [Bacillus sp. 1NLA3E]|uniref:hypothetical protein n=1 Tax=Bacillus sp. 1NLA3E TaxID=666686 RepID=UPI000247E65A|nr:hypothetical protein [Bacillus sp. 1NLA3E]AGK52020.1 hypothetical protein B1NLA3E_01180 [Bacillus sp. 1NLA3E]